MTGQAAVLATALLIFQASTVSSEEQRATLPAGEVQAEAVTEGELGAPNLPTVLSDIRALYALQDAAAGGLNEAGALQKALLQQISRKLAMDIPESLPNALAPGVAGFVLSGGNPALADLLAERQGLSTLHRKLLHGASLYMRGKLEAASVELSDIDVLQLQPSLAGRVALVQAMLETKDEDRRQSLLSVAIATMPGSLVEESALRRSALFYAANGLERLFWKRASRYLRRFQRSLYAPAFLLEATNTMMKLEIDKANPDRLQFDILLAQLPQASRRKLYLHLARQAALRNLVDLSEFAAHRSLRLSMAGSQEAEISELYGTIFDVTSVDSTNSAQVLQSMTGELLPPLERRLLGASLTVTGEINRPVIEGGSEAAESGSATGIPELQKAVELSLAAADEAMKESSQ